MVLEVADTARLANATNRRMAEERIIGFLEDYTYRIGFCFCEITRN